MTDDRDGLDRIGTGHRPRQPTQRARRHCTLAVPAALMALTALTGCSTAGDQPATVTQPWTGVSVTGNALDLAAIVAGTTDPDGTDRTGLSVIAPAVAADRVHASCTGDTAAHLDIDTWHIEIGTDTVTVHNIDRGLSAADLATTPIEGTEGAVTWHDGRVDVTAAADTPAGWNIPGRIYIGATVTCAP
ncbi:MAG: hypothetical protein WBD41_17730 [Rhodococcus sp. (in: high G+C Gram-positive bacteria)]